MANEEQCELIDRKHFALMENVVKQQSFLQDIMLANKITQSGVPNRYGCRIPLCTNWKLDVFEELLQGYEDLEVLEWLKYGLSISRDENQPDPVPSTTNHQGALFFPHVLDEYVKKEVELGAAMGPFTIPPFLHRIGISPLSTRPKRGTTNRRVILDLSLAERKFGE